MLDALEPTEAPGWTDFDNRAEGLTEIIRAAAAHGNTSAVQKALVQLKTTERAVRERSELNRFAGVRIAKAYALAGQYDAARSVAKDVTDEPWEADRAIGVALSAAGRRRDAASMLAKAWRGLQDNWKRSEKPYDALSEIGTALARIGELKVARSVADDIGSDYAHYAGASKQSRNSQSTLRFSSTISLLDDAAMRIGGLIFMARSQIPARESRSRWLRELNRHS